MDYVDNVLVKLRRVYSENEAIQAMGKRLSEKNVEIGKLKAEIDELNDLKKVGLSRAKISQLAMTAAREVEYYRNIEAQNHKLLKEIQGLKRQIREIRYDRATD